MKILITAGPTQEPIDPVRFISNRSSGKMGYAVARAAVARGHDVRLISGPVSIPAPAGATVVTAVTAEDMRREVEASLDWADALVMAAAVADWRPKRVSPHKLKKRDMPAALELEPAPDILKAVAPRKGGRVFVGFAAETRDVEREAARKMREKNLDLTVANNVSRPDSGFGADTNKVTLLTPDGGVQALPVMSKEDVGLRIVEWIEKRGGAATR